MWAKTGTGSRPITPLSLRAASKRLGAPESIASVMPVSRVTSGGCGMPGCTRLEYALRILPSRTNTAATSMTGFSGLSPWVSKSTTAYSLGRSTGGSKWTYEGKLRKGRVGRCVFTGASFWSSRESYLKRRMWF